MTVLLMFSFKNVKHLGQQPNREYFINSTFIESSVDHGSRNDLSVNKGVLSTSVDSKLKQLKLPSICLSTRSKDQLKSILRNSKNADDGSKQSNTSLNLIHEFRRDDRFTWQKGKSPMSILEKTQKNNEALYKKWMKDKLIQKQFIRLYGTFSAFLKFPNNKFVKQFMNFFQFKPYLKNIFLNDMTSLVQVQSDMDFKTFCIKAFQYSLYDEYLNEKYTVKQISEYKKQLKEERHKKRNQL